MTAEEDERWWRAHQYVSRSGAYKLRVNPARSLFGLAVYVLTRLKRDPATRNGVEDVKTSLCSSH